MFILCASLKFPVKQQAVLRVILAEARGFEPPEPLRVHTLSKRAP